MSVGGNIYTVVSLLVFVALAFFMFYGFYAIYYAYFKTKDERQKYIVLRSTAHAFTIVLLVSVLEFAVVFANVAWLTRAWQFLHFNIRSDTSIAPMLSILGVCLFINKQRGGGD